MEATLALLFLVALQAPTAWNQVHIREGNYLSMCRSLVFSGRLPSEVQCALDSIAAYERQVLLRAHSGLSPFSLYNPHDLAGAVYYYVYPTAMAG